MRWILMAALAIALVLFAGLLVPDNPLLKQIGSSSAQAGGGDGAPKDKTGSGKTCAERFASQEQILLERRALGGDELAQYALATCAWPLKEDHSPLYEKPAAGDAEEQKKHEEYISKLKYAYIWLTLAVCSERNADLAGAWEDLEIRNDVLQRHRPFVGKGRIRQEELARLGRTHSSVEDALLKEVSVVRESASKEFVTRLAQLGAGGVVQLAYMRGCPSYTSANERHVQSALWDFAQDEWISRVVGARNDWSPSDAYERLFGQSLSSADQGSFERLQEEYYLFDTRERIDTLRYEAALANMGATPVHEIQLALGAFRKTKFIKEKDKNRYIDVPRLNLDNVYGEVTSKMIQQAQCRLDVLRPTAEAEGSVFRVAAGPDPDCDIKKNGAKLRATGWLTPRQARDLICYAAAERQDAFSYLHLAEMYYQGRGYPRDYDKALYAAQQAVQLFEVGPTQVASNIKEITEGGLITQVRNARERANELRTELMILARQYYGLPDNAAVQERLKDADYGDIDELCPKLPELTKLKKTDALSKPL